MRQSDVRDLESATRPTRHGPGIFIIACEDLRQPVLVRGCPQPARKCTPTRARARLAMSDVHEWVGVMQVDASAVHMSSSERAHTICSRSRSRRGAGPPRLPSRRPAAWRAADFTL